MKILPTLYHDFVEFFCQTRRWREAVTIVHHLDHLLGVIIHVISIPLFFMVAYIWVGVAFKWFVSETPYLVHDTPKAPHITGRGVLLVVDSL
jgi:hypothetical protein